jgi:hypothetical protein
VLYLWCRYAIANDAYVCAQLLLRSAQNQVRVTDPAWFGAVITLCTCLATSLLHRVRDQEEALLQLRALPGAVWEARWSDLLCDVVGIVRHFVQCDRSSVGDGASLRCAILSSLASADERGTCPGSGVLLWLALDDTDSPERRARRPRAAATQLRFSARLPF